MKAILSDIHGNVEALQAILEDIEKRGIEEILSLGDLVGYGPDPVKCVEVANSFKVNLLGNHEQAILFEPDGFSNRAKAAVEWTRKEIERHPPRGIEDPFEFIGLLPKRHSEDNVLYVHGSPREPIQEYVFPADIGRPNKLNALFSCFENVCFVGHTHYAGILTENREFLTPQQLCNIYVMDGVKAIINVGSVGQPRDGDSRASYITFDGDTVVFHRVEYDVGKTADKITRTRGLDNSLGTRLLDGK